ncbi:MAG: DUF1501 domain-containing protein [Planctomycetaceae bacterium]|nr:DUF1501 domain-containing protein [Planctomycetaceae bacterium]
MFTIYNKQSGSSRNVIDRRNFLSIGGGIGALSLPALLQAEARQQTGSSHKALIHLHLGGGPSHQDMFDLKPDAPSEFRGEFNPIHTNVPGLDICEHFPLLSRMADKFAIVRSLVGMISSHSANHTSTGFDQKSLSNIGGRPYMGSVVAKLQGPTENGAPPYISYMGGKPGYLGPVYLPYKPSGNDLKLRSITEDRLTDRRSLLGSLDTIRRDIDSSGQLDALDAYTQQAAALVTSGTVADALDVRLEDPAIVERYGNGQGKNLLLARRLIEAGSRVVTMQWGGWDTHSNNFVSLKKLLPQLDQALSALLEDLSLRGMDQDVTVVVWGEFGRTPRVNSKAGRDHWTRLSQVFLAGGGMRLGQAVGTTSKNAEFAQDRPVHLQEVLATLYHNIGIDSQRVQLHDPTGRPQFLLDQRPPIAELI